MKNADKSKWKRLNGIDLSYFKTWIVFIEYDIQNYHMWSSVKPSKIFMSMKEIIKDTFISPSTKNLH